MAQQAPQDFDTLKKQVTGRYESLSPRLQQVARYLLDHPKDVAFSTVAKIAESTGVTPSALIRFANTFGFSGFSEMQGLFKARLVNEVPNYTERIRAARNATGETPDSTQLLWEFSNANQMALEQLTERIDSASLEYALDILERARAVHVMGARRSFTVASYMTYALHHIDKRAFLVNGLGGMYNEQVRSIGDNDALVVISFSPYAEEARDFATIACERRIPLVVITDSNVSPLAQLADVYFVVQESEVKSFRGLAASLCLAQALAISLGVRHELGSV